MGNRKKLDLLIESGIRCIMFEKKLFQMFVEKEINGEDFTQELQDEYANKCRETTNIVLEIIKFLDCYDTEELQDEYTNKCSETTNIVLEFIKLLNCYSIEAPKSSIKNNKKHKDLINCLKLGGYINDVKIKLAMYNNVPNSQMIYNEVESVAVEYDVILHNLLVEYLREHQEISSISKRKILDTFSYTLLRSCSLTEKFKGNEERYFCFSHPELFNRESVLLSDVKKSCESNIERILMNLESSEAELILHVDKYLALNKDLCFIFPIVASLIQSEKHGVKLDLKEHNLGSCAIGLLNKAIDIYEQYSYVGREIPKKNEVILLKEAKRI